MEAFLAFYIAKSVIAPCTSRHQPLPQKKALSPNCFLEVWDVPISVSSSIGGPQPVPLTTLASVRHEGGLVDAGQQIPPLKTGMMRVYISEMDEDTLNERGLGTQSSSPFYEQAVLGSSKSSSGLEALAAQWRCSPPGWYRLEGWSFLNPRNDTTEPEAGGVRREFRNLRRDVRELVGLSDQQWALTRMKVHIADEGDRLSILISCADNAPELSRHPCFPTEHFASNLLKLEDTYAPLRSIQNVKPAFLLQCHHASLILFADFLKRVSEEYASRRREDIDPRRSTLRRWNLRTIMDDLQLYRRFSDVSAELQTTVGFLADVLQALHDAPTTTSLGAKAKMSILRAELNHYSQDTRFRLEQLSNDLEQDLRFLNLSRDLSQSNNVQALTLLATIFLPLSLSAAVLSMQFRLQELGERLYDFVGIVVLLVYLVVSILILITIRRTALEFLGRLHKYNWYMVWIRPTAYVGIGIVGITIFALILSSFIVGMFNDIGLGAKILGWGLLAAIVGPVALGIVFWVLLILPSGLVELSKILYQAACSVKAWSTKKKETRKGKQRDPEENRLDDSDNPVGPPSNVAEPIAPTLPVQTSVASPPTAPSPAVPSPTAPT
ncbi:hypothetical protein BKA63DRAFT_550164 [Paraphoma chrysanthemicola]|nr:hypothetical protein BKA63DRAFT_550164 [Paraphoma chrysanthemicola]